MEIIKQKKPYTCLIASFLNYLLNKRKDIYTNLEKLFGENIEEELYKIASIKIIRGLPCFSLKRIVDSLNLDIKFEMFYCGDLEAFSKKIFGYPNEEFIKIMKEGLKHVEKVSFEEFLRRLRGIILLRYF